MKRQVGVVETGLEELSLKRICASRRVKTKKRSPDFWDKKTNPSGQSWIRHWYASINGMWSVVKFACIRNNYD